MAYPPKDQTNMNVRPGTSRAPDGHMKPRAGNPRPQDPVRPAQNGRRQASGRHNAAASPIGPTGNADLGSVLHRGPGDLSVGVNRALTTPGPYLDPRPAREQFDPLTMAHARPAHSTWMGSSGFSSMRQQSSSTSAMGPSLGHSATMGPRDVHYSTANTQSATFSTMQRHGASVSTMRGPTPSFSNMGQPQQPGPIYMNQPRQPVGVQTPPQQEIQALRAQIHNLGRQAEQHHRNMNTAAQLHDHMVGQMRRLREENERARGIVMSLRNELGATRAHYNVLRGFWDFAVVDDGRLLPLVPGTTRPVVFDDGGPRPDIQQRHIDHVQALVGRTFGQDLAFLQPEYQRSDAELAVPTVPGSLIPLASNNSVVDLTQDEVEVSEEAGPVTNRATLQVDSSSSAAAAAAAASSSSTAGNGKRKRSTTSATPAPAPPPGSADEAPGTMAPPPAKRVKKDQSAMAWLEKPKNAALQKATGALPNPQAEFERRKSGPATSTATSTTPAGPAPGPLTGSVQTHPPREPSGPPPADPPAPTVNHEDADADADADADDDDLTEAMLLEYWEEEERREREQNQDQEGHIPEELELIT